MIEREFVPLAINGRLRYFHDAEGRFLEQADCGGRGQIEIITAGAG
jgi:hypothetical protein